jgi:hypothetical protein
LVERKMGEVEFTELVGLIVEAVKILFKGDENTGFEAVKLKGGYRDVAFQAWWTWYSFVDGVAGPCKGMAHISHEEL